MLRFSANLSMLFQEYDFLERFEKAAACGFRAVEFMFPYDYAPEVLKHKPINYFDMPGFYLNTTHQALALIDEVGNDNLKIQYDIYHMQRMEGELTHTMQTYANRIGHLQIADNPNRGEPGTGEINYEYLFNFIDKSNYDGWVGCEYKPLTTTEAGLTWFNRYR